MFLKIFSEEHKVYLLTLYENDEELKLQESIGKYCEDIWFEKQSKVKSLIRFLLNIPGKSPFQVAYYKKAGLKEKIRQIIEEHHIDCVYFHLIRMASYLNQNKTYNILDYTDCISREYERSLSFLPLFRKFFYRVEAKRLRKLETTIWQKFDDNWFITADDINSLGMENNPHFSVVPNPVNITETEKNYQLQNKLVFVGNMSVPHNIQAVEFAVNEVMPTISDEVKFYILGANPEKVMRLHARHRSFVLGFVPDLYKELSSCDIFLAPMFYSAGIQNKVLEAMACGLPIVTTPAVAASISAEPGKHLLIADDKRSFLDQINRLLADETLRKEIGSKGKELIKNRYDQTHIRTQILQKMNMISLSR
ncbi:MAG: glycosyltransferase [Candidatus Cloacimonetes bacterium]|nr:glycosyltransferase [Candidatus Cloacimonadota bacterium]